MKLSTYIELNDKRAAINFRNNSEYESPGDFNYSTSYGLSIEKLLILKAQIEQAVKELEREQELRHERELKYIREEKN